MNPYLCLVIAVINLIGTGYFAFAWQAASTGRGQRLIFLVMAFITGLTGIVLLAEAMGF